MKNVVFLTSVKYDRLNQKYGGYEWMEISQKSWEYWCDLNDVELYVYDSPKRKNPINYRVTWQRWFDVFDKLNTDYDKIWMVDSASIIKWNTPNIFDLVDDRFTAFRDMDNLSWIYQSVVGYKPMFNSFKFDIGRYVNCGNAIINNKHQPFLEKVEKFYYDNHELLLHYENTKVKKGTDQTPFNYLLQIEEIDTNIELPVAYNLTHLQRKEMLGFNWQLKEDETPFFIKYGYLWRYNGFPKDQRTNLMNQTWGLVKHNYLDEPTIENLLESINEDKRTNSTTTTNEFKTDVFNFFRDFKDKKCLEFGTHKGQTTKILSYCFKDVITINKTIDSFSTAKALNVGIENIEYLPFDLYTDQDLDIQNVDVVLIDAGHLYYHVVSDINRCFKLGVKYIIFDDYGMNVHKNEVKRAVDEFIDSGKIKILEKIGCEPGIRFGENKILEDYEGLICEIVS